MISCSFWKNNQMILLVHKSDKQKFTLYTFSLWGHAVAQLVEALRYKPEGCGFDS
jgi:hypothetical protein